MTRLGWLAIPSFLILNFAATCVSQHATEPAVPNTPASLRAAITDLASTFGDRYPLSREYLARLNEIQRRLNMPDANAQLAAAGEFERLQRRALIDNPLVREQPIAFVVRAQYPSDHHNTATMFQTDEINTRSYRGRGWLKAIDFGDGGKIETILDPGPNVTPRDLEVSFDGQHILFAMRNGVDDNYHLYEIEADGAGLRQLTWAQHVFDIDPVYLPDGDIVFTSSREPKYCMCNRHIMGNLFRMTADGANIHQIGKSTLFEGHPSVMPDGRLLYDRWEYVDRNFGDAQGLWVVNPDGTNHAIFWGNNTGSPGGVLDARVMPGTGLCLCVFSSCHDRPWGALAIVDRAKGHDGRPPVVRTWPPEAIELVDVQGSFDAFKSVQPKYEDPYPLSSKYFLVSRTVSRETGEQMGIFLVDVFGNENLLHTEVPGCFDPFPLGPRQRPPVVPVRRTFASDRGTFYVQDVYAGPYSQDIPRGSIKYLRVVESPEKRNWTDPAWGGQGQHAPAMNWHSFENKRILGTVPVEQDGSAHFDVPAERFVFFQLLDEDGMMVHSMRSGVNLQPGETQGCVGCHEDRNSTPPTATTSLLALQRAPSQLTGWYGPPREFNYQAEVQPVFDRHCAGCHDFQQPAGEKLRLVKDRSLAFNASYTDLWRLGYIQCVGGGGATVMPAKSWGSHASKLVRVLRDGHPDHKDVRLSAEELDRIVTWIDLNAPYYPVYESAYPDNPCGRSPIDSQQLKQLGELTKATFVTGHNGQARTQISFERPALSPCLQKLDTSSEKYTQALQIIQAGKANLTKTPRADMGGFVPCEIDQERLQRYDQRTVVEKSNRAAILEGSERFDSAVNAPHMANGSSAE